MQARNKIFFIINLYYDSIFSGLKVYLNALSQFQYHTNMSYFIIVFSSFILVNMAIMIRFWTFFEKTDFFNWSVYKLYCVKLNLYILTVLAVIIP